MSKLSFPHSLGAQISPNVYSKPPPHCTTLTCFSKAGVFDILPSSENKSAQLKSGAALFFIHPSEAETIFTMALQQQQTRDIIKEIAILLNSPKRDCRPIHHHYLPLYSWKSEPEVCGHWHLQGEVCWDRVQDVCGGRGASEKLNWWETLSEGRL